MGWRGGRGWTHTESSRNDSCSLDSPKQVFHIGTMSLFKRKTDDERVARLEERLSTLEARFNELERPVRDLEMEWQDWFEKFRNLYARITKRVQREKESTEEANGTAQPYNPLALSLLQGGKAK